MKNNEVVVAAKNPKLCVYIFKYSKNLNPFGPLFVFLWPNSVEIVFIYEYWARFKFGIFFKKKKPNLSYLGW